MRGPRTGPQVYFVEHLDYFNRHGIYGEGGGDYADNHRRFAFFALAALTALPRLVQGPVLLHAHDWHTALAPVYLRTVFAQERCARPPPRVLSVHNPGYQGHFGPEVMPEIGLPWELYNWQQLEWYGKVNFLKGGLVFADAVTTVSPTQAHELRTPGGGFGLHDVFGSWATGSSGSSTASTSGLGSGHRPADHRAVLGREARGQATLQGGAAAVVRPAPAAAACRSSA